jgi:ABC-2 type transport system ATP-binding protein
MIDAEEPGGLGLVVRDVEKRFGEFRLGPVSFRLPRGRALGLLGSNGAGKTTLLARLAGQGRGHAGVVTWNGTPMCQNAWRAKEHVSYVRDVPSLYSELTVGQTITFVSRLQPTWKQRRADELLDVFRLDPRKSVKALSRGMKAKLGLLLGVSHDVQLLLLDEVTAGVDADTRDDIQRLLRGLVVERGISVVVSSHIFEDIEQVSDDVLILRRGAPVFNGMLREVQTLVAVAMPAGVPEAIEQSAALVGTWRGPEGTTLVLRPTAEPQVEEAIVAANAVRRAASLRDLYFAYRERS